MVSIAQLVRVADCGSVGRGFESHYSPIIVGKVSDKLFDTFLQLITTQFLFRDIFIPPNIYTNTLNLYPF